MDSVDAEGKQMRLAKLKVTEARTIWVPPNSVIVDFTATGKDDYVIIHLLGAVSRMESIDLKMPLKEVLEEINNAFCESANDPRGR